MIKEAIWEDKKWLKGTARSTIRTFIKENYPSVDEEKLKENISETLAKMLEPSSNGYACLVRAEANYKLTPQWRKEWKAKNGIKPVKRKKKKPKDAPRGPKNGYLFYVMDVVSRRKEEYPDLTHQEVTKKIGEEWNSLSKSKKEKYETKAAEDRERYKREMKAYNKKKLSKGSSGSSSESSRPTRKRSKKSSESESQSDHKGKKKKKEKPLNLPKVNHNQRIKKERVNRKA